MKRFQTRQAIQTWIKEQKAEGKSIGFVPTMGALHQGHLSLVDNAGKNNDIVVCSVFVNPAQFNEPEDWKKYPRNGESDQHLLEKTGCDAVFLPSVEEMYPSGKRQESSKFNFGLREIVMEGKFRPGHFQGVARVVEQLFEIIQPDRAYFGEKDYQQVIIIKMLVRQKDIPTEVVACPVMREENGLAMSSRNELLSPEQRENAAYIYQTLLEARNNSRVNLVGEVKDQVQKRFQNNRHLRLEYFEIVDGNTLQPIRAWENAEKVVGCIAAYAGNTRLIDNITIFP